MLVIWLPGPSPSPEGLCRVSDQRSCACSKTEQSQVRMDGKRSTRCLNAHRLCGYNLSWGLHRSPPDCCLKGNRRFHALRLLRTHCLCHCQRIIEQAVTASRVLHATPPRGWSRAVLKGCALCRSATIVASGRTSTKTAAALSWKSCGLTTSAERASDLMLRSPTAIDSQASTEVSNGFS